MVDPIYSPVFHSPVFVSMCEQIHTHVVCTTHVGCTSHVLLPVAYTTSKVPITVLSGAGSSGEDLSELPVAPLEQ